MKTPAAGGGFLLPICRMVSSRRLAWEVIKPLILCYTFMIHKKG